MPKFENSVVLIGYSGHALVVAELLDLLGIRIYGYLEEQEVKINPLNLRYIGFERDDYVLHEIEGKSVFAGIGNNLSRMKVMELFDLNGFFFPTLVHPESLISKTSSIDSGSIVCRGAMISPFVKIGKGSIINTGAIIEHECEISGYVHIAPGAVLAGNVKIGERSFVGANSVIKQGVKVGNNVIIGAGSVVLRDLTDNQTFFGNPARHIQ